MPKTDKELAVEIACAFIQASAVRSQASPSPVKPLSASDIAAVLRDTYSVLSSLESEKDT